VLGNYVREEDLAVAKAPKLFPYLSCV